MTAPTPPKNNTTLNVKIKVHVDGGSNLHIWNDIKFFYTFSPTRGKMTQEIGDSGVYEDMGIVISKLSDDHFTPLYLSYLEQYIERNFKYSYKVL